MAVIPPGWGDPEVIPSLVAEHIINNSVQNGDVSAEYLSGAISEITPETQIAGPALLQLTLTDPEMKIIRSGICTPNATGRLQPIDVNFPEGTPVWWRLAMVDYSQDFTQPNLTLTFQHRTIAYLMQCFGALGWPSSKVGTTRAQFMKFLMNKMPSELPSNMIGPLTADGRGGPNDFRFVSNYTLQPVASSGLEGNEVVTAQNAQAKQYGINKLPGLTAAAHITVLGQKPTTTQITNINTILSVGQQLNAPKTALAAAIYAAMGESTLGLDAPAGVFATTGVPSAYDDGTDLAGQAKGFFTGGTSFAFSAIKLAAAGHPIWQIANAVENNAVYENSPGANGGSSPNGTGDSYAHSWAGGQKEGVAEATAIVAAFGGAFAGTTVQTKSDVASLERGTPDDPDEDSWTCMQRLASEVNWNIFSDPHPYSDVWENYVYYLDGPALVAQRPKLYLAPSKDGSAWTAQNPAGKLVEGNGSGIVTSFTSTIDNTAWQQLEVAQAGAAQGRAGSAAVKKQTSIRRPQTPTEIQFNLIGAGVLEFNAGQVVVIRNSGLADGRWIIEDVTHNILGDLFAQVTLGPSTFVYPEPQAGTVVVAGTNGQPVTINSGSSSNATAASVNVAPLSSIQQGALSGVAQAAELAFQQQQSKHVYQYLEQHEPERNVVTPDLFTPAAGPRIMDCSKFATLCYKAAGLPDPNQQNYNPIGATGSLIQHCSRLISQSLASPGDLCFFGTQAGTDSRKWATTHVNVYVGNGQSISMGEQGDPSKGPSAEMGPTSTAGFLGWFRSDVVSKITVAPSATTVDRGITLVKNPIGTIKGTVGPASTGVFGSLFDPKDGLTVTPIQTSGN